MQNVHLILAATDSPNPFSEEQGALIRQRIEAKAAEMRCRLLAFGNGGNHIHIIVDCNPFILTNEVAHRLADDAEDWIGGNDICKGFLGWNDCYIFTAPVLGGMIVSDDYFDEETGELTVDEEYLEQHGEFTSLGYVDGEIPMMIDQAKAAGEDTSLLEMLQDQEEYGIFDGCKDDFYDEISFVINQPTYHLDHTLEEEIKYMLEKNGFDPETGEYIGKWDFDPD